MSLKLQIISLIVSFIYGVIFYYQLNFNYKIVYNEKVIIKVLGTFIFIIANALLYFYILLRINNGIVHIYCLLTLVLGYFIIKKIQKV